MGKAIFHVDAFTDKPFGGNPAAVCFLSEPGDTHWMQNVAKEMNLSETAFLFRQKDGYNLRWFTPTCEVDLCGHATLASAHIIWEEGYLKKEKEAYFYTKSGLLTAKLRDYLIELNFPVECEEEITPHPDLAKALGATPMYVGKSRFDYLVQVESEEELRNLKTDFTLLATLPTRGIIVTSISSSKNYDFLSRFFAPRVGINEDPVTGSAHCSLGPFWEKRLGKSNFIAYQASSRGGILHVKVKGNRVYLGGNAITVLRGELL